MIGISSQNQTEHELNLKLIKFLLTHPAELHFPQFTPHLQHQNPHTESKLKTLAKARQVTDWATMSNCFKRDSMLAATTLNFHQHSMKLILPTTLNNGFFEASMNSNAPAGKRRNQKKAWAEDRLQILVDLRCISYELVYLRLLRDGHCTGVWSGRKNLWILELESRKYFETAQVLTVDVSGEFEEFWGSIFRGTMNEGRSFQNHCFIDVLCLKGEMHATCSFVFSCFTCIP